MAKKIKKEVKVRGDVSKKTVAVLLMVAVVLSVLATWMVMSRTSIMEREEVGEPETAATASINIIGPEKEPANEADATAGISINN